MDLSKYNSSVLSVSVSEYTDEFGVLRDSFFCRCGADPCEEARTASSFWGGAGQAFELQLGHGVVQRHTEQA